MGEYAIYHNPRCSKSREAKRLLDEKGVSYQVVEYLKSPPSEGELRALLQKLGLSARQIIRKNEKIDTLTFSYSLRVSWAILIVMLLVAIGAFSCATLSKLASTIKRQSRVRNLLIEGGFEYPDAWSLSAPQGYSNYAEIDFDAKIRRSGRRSAHVLIHRHPRSDDIEVLHAWVQKIGWINPGAQIRFGGWVHSRSNNNVRLGIKCELERPIRGYTFVTVNVEQPEVRDKFRYVEKLIKLPSVATYITFHAGLSGIGEVWFDDLFFRVESE